MSTNDENLGRPVAWQIRDIPETIRDAVVDQARAEKVNVSELVTRLVLDARAAGWSLKASNGFANASTQQDAVRVRGVFSMVADMGKAGVPVQKRNAALLNRLANQELLALLPSKSDGSSPPSKTQDSAPLLETPRGDKQE